MVILTPRRKEGRTEWKEKTIGKREKMEGGRDEERMVVKYINQDILMFLSKNY
jgi:hypothetical protein